MFYIPIEMLTSKNPSYNGVGFLLIDLYYCYCGNQTMSMTSFGENVCQVKCDQVMFI